MTDGQCCRNKFHRAAPTYAGTDQVFSAETRLASSWRIIVVGGNF